MVVPGKVVLLMAKSIVCTLVSLRLEDSYYNLFDNDCGEDFNQLMEELTEPGLIESLTPLFPDCSENERGTVHMNLKPEAWCAATLHVTIATLHVTI